MSLKNIGAGKAVGIAITVVMTMIIIIVLATGVSVNDNGYRTVVQYPNGTTFVKFDPGWYLTLWGTETVYPDNITFDFQNGLGVRYQDGGRGTVEGIARFGLPGDQPTMMDLHKAFRSENGLRTKMLNTTVQESLNLSAGLMTSEEAYAEKRSLFGDLAKDQVANGKLKTQLEAKNVILADGTVQKTNIPVVIIGEDGLPEHYPSDLSSYGIRTTSFQVKEWNFEPKTVDFINSKRDANMAIITAQADTKKSEQEKLKVIAEGEKDVAAAKYKEEQLKITAEVQAERVKSVALIKASQEKEKAAEMTLAAIEETKRQRQLALAAVQQAKAIKTLAAAEAFKRRELIKSDNGFKLQLANDLAIARAYAKGMSEMNMPATMIIGAGGSGGSSELQNLLQFQVIESAKKAAKVSSNTKR